MVGADDEAVLAGIAERLRDRGKIDRFGVKLIRNPLGLSEHELLLETCDSENRTLHCDVTSRSERPDDVRIVETAWQWKVAIASAAAVSSIGAVCRAEKHATRLIAPEASTPVASAASVFDAALLIACSSLREAT
jgi:hypothetical protein